MEKRKEITLIIFGILLISLVSAAHPSFGSIPPLPDHFAGNVLIYGQNASIGTEIRIYVDLILESSYIITEEGKYDLYVTTGEVENTVEFKILDKLAGSSVRQGGETINLDLSLTTTITPPSGGSSGGGSGGGGGGGSGGSSGGGNGGVVTSPPSTTETTDSDLGSEENTIQEDNLETEEQGKTNPGITGAVIGFLDSEKEIILVLILVIFGLGVMIIKFKPLRKWIKNQ